MKPTILPIALLAMAVLGPARAADLSVTGSANPVGGLIGYDYTFSVTGSPNDPAALDALFLTSDDLSPLNLTILKNGQAAPDWSWLGGDTPTNYLEFFSATDALHVGDTLEVTFTDDPALFAPTDGHAAAGTDSRSGLTVFAAAPVVGPAATPEPGSLLVLAVGALPLAALAIRRRA